MSIIKIGDLKKIKNKWYQCIPRITDGISVCGGCDLTNGMCMDDNGTKLVTCSERYRDDCASVIFKELIKFGEPYINNNKTYQAYRLPMNIERLPSLHNGINLIRCDMVEIETDAMSEKAINLKPFNIDEARAGKPVYTRDGKQVRIVCFDYKGDGGVYPILALISINNQRGVPYEIVAKYAEDGKIAYSAIENDDDLMLAVDKKEGYVNIYKSVDNIFQTEEEAKSHKDDFRNYITTVKIEMEE